MLQASPGKKRSKSISDEEGMAGVELLAQAIDSVIMRVQVGRISIPIPKCIVLEQCCCNNLFPQTESGLSLQVKLSNSTVRLEHMPGLEQRGIALELQVDRQPLIQTICNDTHASSLLCLPNFLL